MLMHHATSARPVVVGIPAKNEAAHIGACLRALAWQVGVRGLQAVVLVNNTTDDTAAVVRALQPALPMQVHLRLHELPPVRANAGHARRLAMQAAAELAGPRGVLLSTDADSRPAPDWMLRNLEALDRGADAVAGRAELAPEDHALIPPRLHADDARECAYAAALEEIACLLDPDPADPWPRHAEHSGASLCATAAMFAACGGIPDLPMGEDRAFFDALRRQDAIIRHAPEVRVLVSGRIYGRAAGGMADTIRRRLARPDLWLDDQLEPVSARIRRERLRVLAREAWRSAEPSALRQLARRLLLPVVDVAGVCGQARFGSAWSMLEERSPALRRQRVPVAGLPEEMRRAQRWLRLLRPGTAMEGPVALPSLAVARHLG